MLRVIQAFAGHAVGDDITDESAIEEIAASDHASFVVRVGDADPEAAAEPETPALPAPDSPKE